MVNEKQQQQIFFALLRLCTAISVFFLLFIMLFILLGGAEVINPRFLFSFWSHADITNGGIFQAIIGTFLLAIGVMVFSVPVGIAAAIYLNEYAQENMHTKTIKIAIRNLAGVPSIVYGIFGLAFFVLFLDLGTSLLAAVLTLSVMTLPWVITASHEALKSVPDYFREASYALGATKWQTVRKVVLPNALAGMLTGAILGLSRAIGETAPIILVGATFFITGLPANPFDKFMALPYHLFILVTQHSSPLAQKYALGTALVLIGLVFLLNFGVFIVRYWLRKKKDW